MCFKQEGTPLLDCEQLSILFAGRSEIETVEFTSFFFLTNLTGIIGIGLETRKSHPRNFPFSVGEDGAERHKVKLNVQKFSSPTVVIRNDSKIGKRFTERAMNHDSRRSLCARRMHRKASYEFN